jgi:hypothetical protein
VINRRRIVAALVPSAIGIVAMAWVAMLATVGGADPNANVTVKWRMLPVSQWGFQTARGTDHSCIVGPTTWTTSRFGFVERNERTSTLAIQK